VPEDINPAHVLAATIGLLAVLLWYMAAYDDRRHPERTRKQLRRRIQDPGPAPRTQAVRRDPEEQRSAAPRQSQEATR
jgi:hypothetical protein